MFFNAIGACFNSLIGYLVKGHCYFSNSHLSMHFLQYICPHSSTTGILTNPKLIQHFKSSITSEPKY